MIELELGQVVANVLEVGIRALYPNKGTGRPGQGHKISPSLLSGRAGDRTPEPVYCADITQIPMARGFVCLVMIRDWYSRKVISLAVLQTMGGELCVDALEGTGGRHSAPETFSTDQAVAKFTSEAFTEALKAAESEISKDGKGRWIDNAIPL